MEADFLRSLGETRRMEAALGRAIREAEPEPPGPGPPPLHTRLGFLRGTRSATAALEASADGVVQGLAGARARFGDLQQGCRVRMSAGCDETCSPVISAPPVVYCHAAVLAADGSASNADR